MNKTRWMFTCGGLTIFFGRQRQTRRSEIDYGRHSELMNPLVMAASTAITLALVFYTIGVFGEARAGSLQKKHLILFWIGFACDTTGTTIMTSIARSSHGAGSPLHAITGALAIVLMLFHAVWATFVLLRGDEKSREGFHKLSVGVWLIWLVPYCVGLLIGIPAVHLSDTATLAVSVLIPVAIGVVLRMRGGDRV